MSEETKRLAAAKEEAGRRLLRSALGVDGNALFEAVADFRIAHAALKAASQNGKGKSDG